MDGGRGRVLVQSSFYFANSIRRCQVAWLSFLSHSSNIKFCVPHLKQEYLLLLIKVFTNTGSSENLIFSLARVHIGFDPAPQFGIKLF